MFSPIRTGAIPSEGAAANPTLLTMALTVNAPCWYPIPELGMCRINTDDGQKDSALSNFVSLSRNCVRRGLRKPQQRRQPSQASKLCLSIRLSRLFHLQLRKHYLYSCTVSVPSLYVYSANTLMI